MSEFTIEAFIDAKRHGAPGAGAQGTRETIRTYGNALRRVERLTGKPIRETEKEDVLTLVKSDFSTGTRNQMLTALRVAFDWAIFEGLADHNPVTGFSYLKKANRLPTVLTADEIERVMAEIPRIAEERRERMVSGEGYDPPDVAEKYELLFRLQAVGGLRISEVLNLRAGDILADGVRVVGKGDKERFVPIRPDILGWLRKYAEGRDAGERVFQGEHGPVGHKKHDTPMGLESVYKYFNEAVKRAGIKKNGKVTPHTLRHSFATQALKKTGRLEIVQDILGHANPATTRIYAQVGRDDLKEEYGKIWD